MDRITREEWRIISTALFNQQLAVGDQVSVARDNDDAAEVEKAERQYEALNVLLTKVAQRTARRK